MTRTRQNAKPNHGLGILTTDEHGSTRMWIKYPLLRSLRRVAIVIGLKAPEDWRTPRPFATNSRVKCPKVLECASPLALSSPACHAYDLRHIHAATQHDCVEHQAQVVAALSMLETS